MVWSAMVRSLMRRWLRSLVTQLPQHPHSESTGLLRFLCGLGFGFVAARYVVVPARPTPSVLGCAAPRSGPVHPSIMTRPLVFGALTRPTTS